MDAAALISLLRTAAPGATVEALDSTDMPTIAVDAGHLLELFQVLRDNASLQYAFLVDVTAVDVHPATPRYEIVYHLACLGPHFMTAGATSPAEASRLRVKARVDGPEPRVPSVTSIYPTAGWPEREVFDLFGIGFDGHPDLRRILMPEDWNGHPLRKDYPVQIRKDTASWSPLQVTAEEFARNVRASKEQATREAKPHAVKTDRRS
jgi:NADH-quinone oxidoreductase subunit C